MNAEVFRLVSFYLSGIVFMRMKHDIGLFLSVIRRAHGFALTGYVGCLQKYHVEPEDFLQEQIHGAVRRVRQCLHSLAKFRNRFSPIP